MKLVIVESEDEWKIYDEDESGYEPGEGLFIGSFYSQYVVDHALEAGWATMHEEPQKAEPWHCSVVFDGYVDEYIKGAAIKAMDRMNSVVLGPSIILEVALRTSVIDGEGGVQAFALPTQWDERKGTGLPVKGIIRLDVGDAARLSHEGKLTQTIFHEALHCMGLLTVTERTKNMFVLFEDTQQLFVGKRAMEEYGKLVGSDCPVPIPLAGARTRTQGHLAQLMFGNEYLTATMREPKVLSAMTLAVMEDYGYTVDPFKAEPFELSARQLRRVDPRWECQGDGDELPSDG